MLYEQFYKQCKKAVPTRTSDGYGGSTVSWTYTTEFKAAIVHDSSVRAKIAEVSGVTDTFTVTVGKDVSLKFHDVIVDNESNVYRLTSNAKASPSCASFSFNQFTAERWKLT